MDFEEEEKADEEELNNIQQRKKDKLQDQSNPFDLDSTSTDRVETDNTGTDNIDSNINNDINNEIDTNMESPSESIMQINDNMTDDNILSNDKNQSDIIKIDEEIDNINLFMKHMEQRGYQLESSRFLTKKFAESSDIDTIYNINITINNEVITAITGYDDNNKVITIPKAIINTVKNDINKALKVII